VVKSASSSGAAANRPQEQKFTVEQAIVDLLDHVDDLVARTRDLGLRHVAFGARSEHYEQVGLAIEEALRAVLGTRFDADTAEAWRYAYNLVAEAMQQGATASTAPRGAADGPEPARISARGRPPVGPAMIPG
jgi:hemoglobin-like flavoprotein